MTHPRLNPNILLSPVESGYIAYDAARDMLHELNPVAALIAELCNGARTVAAVRAIAEPFVPEGNSGDIDKWIEGAIAAGLLIQDNDVSGTATVMGAAELSSLASHLRDYGKIQTAFLCARRVVELSPNDTEAWCAMAELAHIVGRREQARIGYEKYLQGNPEDAEVRHILTALRDETPPARVPDACIQQLYRKFSTFYESNMVDTLDYQAPERLGEAIQAVLGDKGGLKILDLGCGTGLSGLRLRSRAVQLTGVDLSPEMVEHARSREIYDSLSVAEITQWLADCQERFDLIVACDTLIYFGDLAPVIRAAQSRLKDDGIFVFSVERGTRHPYQLTDSGRYAHHRDYVAALAADTGMRLLRLEEGYLRMEYGSEVIGLFAAMRKEPG
jgi:predicted TPR repeat methyltransferase